MVVSICSGFFVKEVEFCCLFEYFLIFKFLFDAILMIKRLFLFFFNSVYFWSSFRCSLLLDSRVFHRDFIVFVTV